MDNDDYYYYYYEGSFMCPKAIDSYLCNDYKDFTKKEKKILVIIILMAKYMFDICVITQIYE